MQPLFSDTRRDALKIALPYLYAEKVKLNAEKEKRIRVSIRKSEKA